MQTSILFLIFNRPGTTKRVFESICRAKPPRLYLASDGPRKTKEGEKEIVEQTRKYVLDHIDWKCEVKTLFREENLGCGRAVSGAITWFFQNEPEGIILEDDCLPDPTFFTYCEELLNYYRDNKKVMHISGDQFVPEFDNGASYYFAKIQHCWGWASWADRWEQYNFDLTDYPEENVQRFSEDKNVQNYWLTILQNLKAGRIDTWDYQWAFKVAEKDGLSINPARNLVSNVGFGSGGTHTFDENHPLANMPTFPMGKVIHPSETSLDQKAVDWIYQNHFCIPYKKTLLSRIKNYLFS